MAATAVKEATVNTGPDTIVLIHGLWMTPRSWEHWQQRYERRGYKVIAPAWPGMEAEVEELNRDPSPIARLTIEEIVDHYEKLIRNLPQPPIIIGHSFGGAFTQILLDRGVGAVGVGLASATVKGVLDLPLSTLKSSWPALKPGTKGHAVPLTPEEFHYAFTNTLTPQDSQAVFERYHVPAATLVLREGAFANFHREPPTKVDFHRQGRAPMLLIAFGEDHVIPPKAARHNEEKYDDAASITEFKLFEGRPHFPGVPGWEEVADYSLAWAVEHAPLTVAGHGDGLLTDSS